MPSRGSASAPACRCRTRALSGAATTQRSPYVQTVVDDMDCINLGIGQPSPAMLQPLMRPLRAAAAAALAPNADACLLQYGAGRGTEPFRTALAAFLVTLTALAALPVALAALLVAFAV